MKKTAQKPTKIWVLVDNRLGNANQAIELAESLEESFEIKHIEYNIFGNLPNSLLCLFPIHVKQTILSELKASIIPEIIITSGRRTAALSVYLKKISKEKIKIIQIMRPDLSPENFDLIILPQHDSFNYSSPNIVRTLGALTNIQGKFSKMNGEFEEKYSELGRFIAVIIGGSTKNYKLSLKNAKIFKKRLSVILDNHSLPLFISFSRRTPKNIKKYFRENFPWPNIIYDPASMEYNPYPAILKKAEYVILTTDSISMCSEAASTGKPVYVFCPESFKIKKHNFFTQQLVDLGVVRRFDETTHYLEKYKYKPLSEITRVAGIIKDKIFQ